MYIYMMDVTSQKGQLDMSLVEPLFADPKVGLAIAYLGIVTTAVSISSISTSIDISIGSINIIIISSSSSSSSSISSIFV